MRVLIVGCGLAGTELATSLTADGHEVVGTTTTPEKVEKLQQVCTEVAVLRGSERDKVHAAAEGADAIVVAAGPAAARAMTREERAATYHDVLVATAESVTSVPGSPHIVALSSNSVYGDAADNEPEVTEDSPVTTDDDPSPVKFLEMEAVYRAHGDRVAIFRCADIFGGEDPPIEVKIKMAHEVLGGSIPFSEKALLYRVNVMCRHAIDNKLVGTYNLTHEEVPPSNGALFDAISEQLGFGKLTYRNEMPAPAAPISTARLRATGFELRHTPVERLPS